MSQLALEYNFNEKRTSYYKHSLQELNGRYPAFVRPLTTLVYECVAASNADHTFTPITIYPCLLPYSGNCLLLCGDIDAGAVGEIDGASRHLQDTVRMVCWLVYWDPDDEFLRVEVTGKFSSECSIVSSFCMRLGRPHDTTGTKHRCRAFVAYCQVGLAGRSRKPFFVNPSQRTLRLPVPQRPTPFWRLWAPLIHTLYYVVLIFFLQKRSERGQPRSVEPQRLGSLATIIIAALLLDITFRYVPACSIPWIFFQRVTFVFVLLPLYPLFLYIFVVSPGGDIQGNFQIFSFFW